jgi:hypothetical protein
MISKEIMRAQPEEYARYLEHRRMIGRDAAYNARPRKCTYHPENVDEIAAWYEGYDSWAADTKRKAK